MLTCIKGQAGLGSMSMAAFVEKIHLGSIVGQHLHHPSLLSSHAERCQVSERGAKSLS